MKKIPTKIKLIPEAKINLKLPFLNSLFKLSNFKNFSKALNIMA